MRTQCPAIEMLSTKAKGETSQGTPTLSDMRLTACGMPCSAEISVARNGNEQRQSTANI